MLELFDPKISDENDTSIFKESLLLSAIYALLNATRPDGRQDEVAQRHSHIQEKEDVHASHY